MYVQYKDAIRLKKCATLCVLKVVSEVIMPCYLHQYKSTESTQEEGRRAQIRKSARQVARNVNYTGGFLSWHHSQLVPYHLLLVLYLPSYQDLQLVYFLLVLTKRLVVDGLFLKHGNDISDGAGLLMGKNSLFKNIPTRAFKATIQMF